MEHVIAAAARALHVEASTLRVHALERTGEALASLALDTEADPGHRWVAKRLHPALRRELAAYRGPLAGLDLAPRLVSSFEDREGVLWILLEDAGRPLAGLDPAGWLAGAAALAARIHDVPAERLRVPFWRRPVPHLRRKVMVHHGRRHLAGEWRIALDRIEEGVRAGVLENDVAPTDAEAHHVLDEAWAAMAAGGSGLVHGDLQPTNLLRDDRGRVRAIDWSGWGTGSPLVDLMSVTLDLSEEDRDRFTTVYLERRGLGGDGAAWRDRLRRALPLRQLLGVGVLAHYAAHGLRRETVEDSLPRRLEGWNTMRTRA